MIEYKATIDNFEQLEDMCWSGALTTLKQVKNKGLEQELMDLLVMLSEGEPFESDTQINDLIWHELETFEPFEDLWN